MCTTEAAYYRAEYYGGQVTIWQGEKSVQLPYSEFKKLLRSLHNQARLHRKRESIYRPHSLDYLHAATPAHPYTPYAADRIKDAAMFGG